MHRKPGSVGRLCGAGRLACAWGVRVRVIGAVLAVMGLLAASPALGQAGGGAAGGGQGAPAGQTGAGAAGGGGVAIEVETFGAGGVVRPGDWAGVRLRLTDRGSQPRLVAVRLHLRDDDGDTQLAERRVTLNPGRPQGVWLYARLPWNIDAGSVLPVSVYALAAGEDPQTAPTGRQLGATRIGPDRVLPPEVDLIGVIGRETAGLSQYKNRWSGDREGRLQASHEVVAVVSGLEPAALPDRWMGLAAFGVLAWTDEEPSSIGSEAQASALVEWVHRGGHLIGVMAPVGSTWLSGQNPIAPVVPEVEARRVEDVSLLGYRSWLTKDGSASMPDGAIVQAFEIDRLSERASAMPIVTGPHGVVAVRRLAGTGMTTLVGLDVTDRALTRRGMPRGDVFWHRLTGKRFDTPTDEELREAGAVRTSTPWSTEWADRLIAPLIAKESNADVGLLLALVVFVGYWVVAGPGGFWALKLKGWQRHAWVSFIAATAVFAGVAWAGAAAVRVKGFEFDHLTMLDHVYGQPVQRTRTWGALFLPSYGAETVILGEPGRVGGESAGGGEWVQAVSVWSAPEGGALLGFPDARPYAFDVRRPDRLPLPSRATAKQLRLDWLGGVRWRTPRPVGPGWEPRLADRGAIGRLVHDLPGPLEHVRLILVRGQVEPGSRSLEREGASRVRAEVATAPFWEPGATLDLSDFFPDPAEPLGTLTGRGSLTPVASPTAMVTGDGAASLRPRDVRRSLERVSLRSQLEPPDYTDASVTRRVQSVRVRETHDMDLGAWFTQPCLIVIGHIESGPTPTPVFVGGSGEGGEVGATEAPSVGRTVVRWIYPLAPDPVRYDGRRGGGR